jgi:hypothetical protein
MSETWRDPSNIELELIHQLLKQPFQGRDQLREQLIGMKVRNFPNESFSLQLKVNNLVPAKTDFRIPVEAYHSDSGDVSDGLGNQVRIYLHVVDEYMNELELVKDDGSPITNFPEPLRLFMFIRPKP